MISKLGKLRSLARDLKKNYTGAATNEFPGLAYFRHILPLVFTLPIFGGWNCLSEIFHPIIVLEFPSIRHCRCVKSLESEITKIDAEYDKCQEAWANGEVANFTGDTLLGWYMFYHSSKHLNVQLYGQW